MFRIELLPAQRGDAIWITYGPDAGPHRHVLVDAGPAETVSTLVPALEDRLRALPGADGTDRVELLVVTHIDADHIQGVVALLSDPRRVPLFRDVWFNGWKHHQPELLGGVDAERLTASLDRHPDRWNGAFGGRAVRVPDEGLPPTVELEGGMRLTVLAPDAEALRKLVPEWEKACLKAGVAPGQGAPITRRSWQRDELLGGFDADLLASARFSSDASRPNRAGIAFLAAYDGRRALLLSDCTPGPVLAALDRLEPRPHRFDAVKMAHHGSRRNTSLEFARAVQSPRWLVSTDGAVFGHPDPEALARVVVGQDEPPTFFFNYDTTHIADVVSAAGERFRVVLPPERGGAGDAPREREEGITVDL